MRELRLPAGQLLDKLTADITLCFADNLSSYIFFSYQHHNLRRPMTFLSAWSASALPANFLYRPHISRPPAHSIPASAGQQTPAAPSFLHNKPQTFAFFFYFFLFLFFIFLFSSPYSTSPLLFPIYRIFIFSIFFLRISA